MSELKPCPFCGSEAKLYRDSGNEVHNQSWNGACTRCWCSARKIYGSNTWAAVKKEDKAAEAQAILGGKAKNPPQNPAVSCLQRQ